MGGSFGASLGSFFGGALFVVGLIVSISTLSPAGLGLMGAGYLLLDMSGFFQGKNVILVNATTVMVSDPETYEKVKVDSVVRYDKLGWDAPKYLANYAKSGDAQFRAFYNFGKSDYLDGIPQVRLQTTGVIKESVEELLAADTGVTKFTLYNFNMSPTPPEKEWVLFYLQSNYDYNISTQLCTINGAMYEMTSYVYNVNNNTYDATLTPVATYKKVYYTLVEVNIDSYDSTTELITTTTTSKVQTYAQNSLGILINTQDTITSVVTSYEPIDTVESSRNITLDKIEIEPSGVSDDLIIAVPQYPQIALFYYATYIPDSNPNRRYIWIQSYTNEENIGQLISKSVKSTNQIETYPFVMLRNSFHDITEYAPSNISTNIHDYPTWGDFFQAMASTGFSQVRSEWRYKNTKEFLKRINVNVDDMIEAYHKNGDVGNLRDAYFHFGIRPSDQGETVSKALYEILEYFDEELHPTEPLIKMALGISCHTFIADIKWRYLFPEIKNEVIGNVGTYKHEIKDWLIVREYVINTVTESPTWDEAVAAGYDPSHLRYGGRRGEVPGALYYYYSPLFKITKTYSIEVTRNPEKVYEANDDGISTWTGGYKNGELLYTIPWRDATVVITAQDYNYVSDGDAYVSKAKYGYGTRVSRTVQGNQNPIGFLDFVYSDWDMNFDGGPLGDEDPHTRYTLVVKKQITATQTRTYYMYIPRTLYYIAQDAEDGVADVYLGDEEFWLPLPVVLVDKLSVIEKTQLIGNCMFITFFAYQKKHLNWYETEEFGAIIKALGIVIVFVSIFVSIVTFNPGPTATAMEIFTVILERLLVSAALYGALTLISTYVADTTLKMILSVAATAIAMYAGGAFDSLEGMNVVKLLELPVQACDIYTKDLQSKIASVAEKTQNLMSQYEARMEEYEDAFAKINGGLSTKSLASMPYDASGSYRETADLGYFQSCSMFYAAGISLYTNFNSLYTGFFDETVSKYCSNQLRLGVLSDS